MLMALIVAFVILVVAPPTFFRAANREIAIAPTHKLLEILPTFLGDLTPSPQAESSPMQNPRTATCVIEPES